MHNRSPRVRSANERSNLAFRIEISGDGIAVSLPNRHNNSLRGALVPCQATITAMCFDVAGRDRSAPMAANRWTRVPSFAPRTSRKALDAIDNLKLPP